MSVFLRFQKAGRDRPPPIHSVLGQFIWAIYIVLGAHCVGLPAPIDHLLDPPWAGSARAITASRMVNDFNYGQIFDESKLTTRSCGLTL
jgi:hypothetical protein